MHATSKRLFELKLGDGAVSLGTVSLGAVSLGAVTRHTAKARREGTRRRTSSSKPSRCHSIRGALSSPAHHSSTDEMSRSSLPALVHSLDFGTVCGKTTRR